MSVQNVSVENKRKSEAVDAAALETHVSHDLTRSPYEVDVLSQFKANMSQLEDLQARFKFVFNEVSSLLSKK